MSDTKDLVRDALNKNAERAKEAAAESRPVEAEQYAAATLKLSQALATLLSA